MRKGGGGGRGEGRRRERERERGGGGREGQRGEEGGEGGKGDNTGELSVDHGNEGGVDVGEDGGGVLGAHEGAAEEALATDEVLAEELEDDVLDVRGAHLVDQPINALLQCIPCHALVLLP